MPEAQPMPAAEPSKGPEEEHAETGAMQLPEIVSLERTSPVHSRPCSSHGGSGVILGGIISPALMPSGGGVLSAAAASSSGSASMHLNLKAMALLQDLLGDCSAMGEGLHREISQAVLRVSEWDDGGER